MSAKEITLPDGTKATADCDTYDRLGHIFGQEESAWVKDEDGYVISRGGTLGEAINDAKDKHS